MTYGADDITDAPGHSIGRTFASVWCGRGRLVARARADARLRAEHDQVVMPHRLLLSRMRGWAVVGDQQLEGVERDEDLQHRPQGDPGDSPTVR
jgi:hypothetical protein